MTDIRNIAPYQIEHPSTEEEWKTIEIIVPTNYGNGSLKFLMCYNQNPHVDSDITPYNGPYISTHYDQHLNTTNELNPILIHFDDRIRDNLNLVINYFHYLRWQFEREAVKNPPTLEKFKEMQNADEELNNLILEI